MSNLPFQEFVVKVYERCNLACKYCYMYELRDQSWRERDLRMATVTFENVVHRIAEHVATHQLREINFVFHGGEPLLSGIDFIDWAAEHLHDQLGDTHVNMRIQTNGTLLNQETLDVLDTHGIKVGVSLDGDQSANDRYRRGPKGTSSFELAISGISILQQPDYVHLFRGIYSVVDTRNDPVHTYEFLKSFNPPMIDFLLPYHNWEFPPPKRSSSYADWLIKIFDQWFFTSKQTVQIRLFFNIILGLLGGNSEVSSIGISPSRTVFIDTDGSLEQVDSLKSAYEGASGTGMNVFNHSLDEALKHPGFVARQQGTASLSKKCQKCSIVEICGAGDYPHRYHPETEFQNPSVYCEDLQKLILHIAQHLELLSVAKYQVSSGHGDQNQAVRK